MPAKRRDREEDEEAEDEEEANIIEYKVALSLDNSKISKILARTLMLNPEVNYLIGKKKS